MNTFITDLLVNLEAYYHAFVALLPKVVMALLAFVMLVFVANRTCGLLADKLTKRMDDPLLAQFLAKVAKIILIIFALMVAMRILGLADIAAGIITGASVSAIVIGFAFKDIGENFLAGIILAFNRPFRVGDIVELGSNKGSVVALNMRTTQIKSFDGKDIYIPNASVVTNPVTNYTIDGFIRNEFTIGLDYGSNVEAAIAILEKVMQSTKGVLKGDKKPLVFISSLEASTLNLTVYYWLDTFDKKTSAFKVRTAAINRALLALTEAGFYLPGNILELKNYNEKAIGLAGNPGSGKSEMA